MKKISRATIRPTRSLDLLSHSEVDGVMASNDDVFQEFRTCALAVLNTGSESDDVASILQEYDDFSVRIIPESRGIKLEVNNAPASAFVDGKMIRGIQEHLFTVLRDIVYTQHKINRDRRFDLQTSAGITDAIFRILRNAGEQNGDPEEDEGHVKTGQQQAGKHCQTHGSFMGLQILEQRLPRYT